VSANDAPATAHALERTATASRVDHMRLESQNDNSTLAISGLDYVIDCIAERIHAVEAGVVHVMFISHASDNGELGDADFCAPFRSSLQRTCPATTVTCTVCTVDESYL